MTTLHTPTSGDELSGAIVVGVDGSKSSQRALEWAMQQARLTGPPLVAVTTWEWPTAFGAPVEWPSGVDFEADATAVLRDCVAAASGGHDDLDVTLRVEHGHAAVVLTDASTLASLVVVGSRGHGEFAGLLLGSVSSFLTSHARCPVVVVHYGERD